MKKLLILFSVLFALGAAAQSTTITSTIIDPLGNSWGYGTVTAVFQNAPGTGHPVWSGGTLNPIPPTVTLSSGGSFTMSLPSTNAITPAGGTWIFSVCPNSSQQCAVFATAVIGTTLDINPLITAASAWPTQLVISTPVAKVYNVNQTFPPPLSQGGMLYDTTTQSMLVYTNTGWQPFATVGSGVPVLTNPSGSQVITQPSETSLTLASPAATSGSNMNSPSYCIQGSYFNVTNQPDPWCFLDTVGTGTNPNSTISFAYTGSSTGTHTIAFGNPFTAPSVNNVLFADDYAGADIGAKINATFTAAVGGAQGNQNTAVEVDLSPGTIYTFSTQILIPSNQTATAPWIFNSVLNCKGATLIWNGSGDAINVQSENAGGLTGAIENCNILNGPGNTSSLAAIHQYSRVGFSYIHNSIGFQGPFNNSGGSGIFIDNPSEESSPFPWGGYNEQTRFIDDFIALNTVDLKFVGSDGGTGSFARTMISGTVLGTNAGQVGMQVVGNGSTLSAYIYNSSVELRGNIAEGSTALQLESGGTIATGTLNLGFENTSGVYGPTFVSDFASGSAQLTVNSTSGLYVGQVVSGTYIQPGSFITSISSPYVNISNPVTGNATNETVTAVTTYLISIADTASQIYSMNGLADGNGLQNFLCATCVSSQIQMFNPDGGAYLVQAPNYLFGVAQGRNSKVLVNQSQGLVDGSWRYGMADYDGSSLDAIWQLFYKVNAGTDLEVDSTTGTHPQVNISYCTQAGCGFGPGYGLTSYTGGGVQPTHAIEYTTIGTQSNCNTNSCGSAASGRIVFPAGVTTETITTTAATTASNPNLTIYYTGTAPTNIATLGSPAVTAFATGSFTITLPTAPVTNAVGVVWNLVN